MINLLKLNNCLECKNHTFCSRKQEEFCILYKRRIMTREYDFNNYVKRPDWCDTRRLIESWN